MKRIFCDIKVAFIIRHSRDHADVQLSHKVCDLVSILKLINKEKCCLKTKEYKWVTLILKLV